MKRKTKAKLSASELQTLRADQLEQVNGGTPSIPIPPPLPFPGPLGIPIPFEPPVIPWPKPGFPIGIPLP